MSKSLWEYIYISVAHLDTTIFSPIRFWKPVRGHEWNAFFKSSHKFLIGLRSGLRLQPYDINTVVLGISWESFCLGSVSSWKRNLLPDSSLLTDCITFCCILLHSFYPLSSPCFPGLLQWSIPTAWCCHHQHHTPAQSLVSAHWTFFHFVWESRTYLPAAQAKYDVFFFFF